MIHYNEKFDDNSILRFFIKPQNDPARGQTHFCYNLIVNLFEKRNSPCEQDFPEVRIKRQILDPYHKIYVISHITKVYLQLKLHHQI